MLFQATSDPHFPNATIMKNASLTLLLALLPLIAACGDETPAASTAPHEDAVDLTDWDPRMAPEDLESGRSDASWQRVVQLDTAGLTRESVANPETWEQIEPQTVNTTATQLPIYRESEGPSVLRAQILLDRVMFSPGIIDGRWGKNTEKAVYWFQQREGLRRTGWIDQETFDRLVRLAGVTPELIRTYTVTEDDVAGPFVTIPEDIYEKAELDCMCYESVTEKLSELFHTAPAVLQKLNPGVDLDALTAGMQIQVPNVRGEGMRAQGEIAKIVVSAEGFYVHALDASGRILYHFPTTLGSSFDPSPTGNHSIAKITRDPWWHYQPAILEHVDDSDEDAMIPAGPNNAVGVVWMALSLPHYGIHGTSAPETIGYTTSAGCVRLTNWDALFLSGLVREGTPVQFSADPAPAPSSNG